MPTKRFRWFWLLLLTVVISGCASIFGVHRVPPQIEPVQPFELDRYLGRWYEIARLDHRFERNLSQVTAQYNRSEEGIEVINRGYNTQTRQWEKATGKARFVDDPNTGHLKVSFFWPIYSGYIVFHNDDYEHVMVTGPSKEYFWLLSRKPKMPMAAQSRFIAKAKRLGFATDKLIFVDQSNQSVAQ